MGHKPFISELLEEYQQRVAEREELRRELENERRALSERYTSMRDEAISFCCSKGFQLVMQALCEHNRETLYFSPDEKRMTFKGQAPKPLAFDSESCFAVKDEAKKMMLAVRAGNPRDEIAIQNLCVGYVTLIALAKGAKALYDGAKDSLKARANQKLTEINAGLKSCKTALSEELAGLSGEDDTDRKGILVGTHAVAADPETKALLERIAHTHEPLRDERILLGFDGNCSSLHISVTDQQKKSESFREFLNGLFYRNFLQFSVGELMLAGIEDSGLSELPLSHMIGNLSDFDPERDEANLRGFAYEDPAKDRKSASALLDSIVGELNERKTLLGSYGADDNAIEAYNEKNPYNKKPCILLLINGYPGEMGQNSWDNDRGNLRSILRDGGRYGIYTVIMEDPAPPAEVETAEFWADLCERRIDFSAPTFTPVAASPEFVSDVRRRAVTELKQNKILYLDDLLARNPRVSHFSTEITIPMGVADGKIYYFATSVDSSRGKFDAAPFTLIVGSTGMGKSAFLHTLILGGAMCYSPDELQFYIVDFKSEKDSAEFSCYLRKEGVENLYVPHVRYISMKSTAENAYDVLDMIGTISNDRGALFSSLGIKDFVDYNSNDEIRRRVEAGELPHVPQIYFLIDEYITMLSGGVGGKKKNAADNDLDERLRDLLQRVRSSGVGVIFSGQRSEFSGDTLGLIGNRISFDPGHENLFNKMFTFDFAKEDSGALYRRIRGRIGTAVSARKDGTKKVVRTAFSGQQMKNRQLALAKAIREKYNDPRYDIPQIVPGADVIENGDRFLEDEASHPITAAERKRQAEEKEQNIPLYTGVSVMKSKPIPLRFYLHKQECALVLANPAKQQLIERNAAASFWHYMAVNSKIPATPRVILNDLTSHAVLTDEFGDVIEGSDRRHALEEVLEEQGLSHLCRTNHSASEVAASILEAKELWESRRDGTAKDRGPILMILHDTNALLRNLEDGLKREPIKREEKAEAPVAEPDTKAAEPEDSEEDLAFEDFDVGDDILNGLRSVGLQDALDSVIESAPTLATAEIPEPEEAESKPETHVHEDFEQVRKALIHLIHNGNKQSIFVLASFSEAGEDKPALKVDFGSMDIEKRHCAVVYGSDSVRNTLDCDSDGNADCCFLVPQESRLRLYDLSSSAKGFWENLKKYC